MKRRTFWFLSVLLVAMLLLGACSAAPGVTQKEGLQEAPQAPDSGLEAPLDANRQSLSGEGAVSSSYGTSGVSERVIKSASLEIEVEKGKLKEVTGRLTLLAEGKRGYMQSSQLSSGDGWQQAVLMIVIPVNEFGATLAEVEKLGDVLSSSTSGQDVTQEYHDLELDLTHWEAERQSALLLLEKAQTIDEIIKVRQFLEPIDRQLNEIKGRIQFLKGSSDFSKIQVSLTESGAVPVTNDDSFWSRVGEVFLRSISVLLYILVAVLPWGLLALLVLYIVFRFLRRNRPSSPPPAPHA
ncbi:MAG: DUF4349 domain-containing protein [Coprothermobacterota bacterium]|nr:DUF4349 domain-containing protein [Coprothermobacterota bacterium]